jgi:Zn-dependent protease
MNSGTPLGSQYSWTTTRPQVGRVTTSAAELVQITVAFLVITLDLVLILYGGGLVNAQGFNVLAGLPLWLLAVAATTSFTAFVCHELAHKISAQRHGYWAEFRWSPFWLVLSIVVAYSIGFLFAAPGATVVGGMGDRREWARTSLAGPAANMGFAAAFGAISFTLWHFGNPYYSWILIVATLNALFGAFNLLPMGPLDGAKVFAWDKLVWAVAFALAAAETIFCYIALSHGGIAY